MQCILPLIIKKTLIGVVLIPEKDELWISNGKNVWCEKRDNSKQSLNLYLEKDISRNDSSNK